jgi:hypothetical protein
MTTIFRALESAEQQRTQHQQPQQRRTATVAATIPHIYIVAKLSSSNLVNAIIGALDRIKGETTTALVTGNWPILDS